VSARFQKELEAVARRTEQSETRHREEIQALQVQLGDARHRSGVLKGNLEALRNSNAACVKELDALRSQLATTVSNQEATRKRPLSSVETNKPRRAAPKVATRKRSPS
jgi:predicted  nucleic acid-binding Zn-ribbon protein